MEHPANPRMKLMQSCMHQLRLFFIALQFFTRLPIPRWVGFSQDWLQSAIRYFPAVGIVVGAITAGSYMLFCRIWNPAIAVLLSTAIGIYLTGALHEDGFADTCDGLGGGYTPERILEIMRDSRVGSYGAIGIVMLLAVKCISLASLPIEAAAAALLSAHPLSRLGASVLVWRLNYVRDEGRAKPLAQQMSDVEFGIALVTALIPVGMCSLLQYLPWHAIAAGIIAVCLATYWLARFFIKRIGGYTGDCLGAVQQFSEVAFYLGLLAFVSA
jgi:adenosylcobinamide-GDP ribazoletransferase